MKHKSYQDIEVAKENNIQGFEVGDRIVIQTKVDGANAAIRYDAETDTLVAQSRKKILDMSNTLNGFYGFVQGLDKDKFKAVLGDNLIAFGEWNCLSGDTLIRKTSGGKNSNYMTLREMYQYNQTPCPDRIHQRLDTGRPLVMKQIIDNPNILENDLFALYTSKYRPSFMCVIRWLSENGYIQFIDNSYIATKQGKAWYEHYVRGDSWWDRHGFPSLYSLNMESDTIVPNKMVGIFYTGDKDVYRVTTRKGYSIKATLEHPFLTPKGFVCLKDLKQYDCVAVSELAKKYDHRYHGHGYKKIYDAIEDYKSKIGKCEFCGTTKNLNLHHKDLNPYNNNESNFMVLCESCHKQYHKTHKKEVSHEYDYEFDYIVSIDYAGVEDCYDISMSGDEHLANFVADGFIVHNCKHTVIYAPEYVNKFFMFDVYDTEIGQYLAQDDVHKIADALGLQMVETFYDGPFVSWEHCRSFLDASVYGETMQEGIVVKNITKLLRDRDRTQLSFDDHYFFGPAYLKIVNDAFRETKAHSNKPKETDPEVRQRYLDNIERAKEIITERRVEKAIQKAQDNGELPSALSMKDMGLVCKVIPKAVYEDCLKEERDTALAIDDFSKICSKVSIDYAKAILMAKNI